MSVVNGQRANATNFNAAFVSKTVDSTTIGKLDLNNSDTASGSEITNAQREFNAIASFLGSAVNAIKTITPTWISNNVGTASDTIKAKIEALDVKIAELLLLAGRSGGQIATGGTAASDTLTLRSTSNVTKGKVLLDEATESTTPITGALVVYGGVGVGKALNIGGDLATPQDTDANGPTLTALASAGKSSIRLTYSGAVTISGISGGYDGKFLCIHNVTGSDATIKHQDGGASASDRIITSTAGDLTLSNGAMALLQYDATTARWRLVAGGGGSGGSFVSSNFTGTTISPVASKGFQRFMYLGSSAQTLTQIDTASVTEATEITIFGTSDTNTITIPTTATNIIYQNGDVTLGNGRSITYHYYLVGGGWMEKNRN